MYVLYSPIAHSFPNCSTQPAEWDVDTPPATDHDLFAPNNIKDLLPWEWDILDLLIFGLNKWRELDGSATKVYPTSPLHDYFDQKGKYANKTTTYIYNLYL